MLLRTVVLVLLCASVGMSATIRQYQTETQVTEAAAAADDDVVADLPGIVDYLGANGMDVSQNASKGQEIAATKAAASREDTDKILAADKPEVKNVSADAESRSEESVSSSAEEENEIRASQTDQSLPTQTASDDDSNWSINSIREQFRTIHGYLDSLVELVGGHNGMCQYRCRYGKAPQPRAGYQLPEPNGCSSSLVGLQLDLGIPAMTKCCDQLDVCYDTCGMSKYDCDTLFRGCLYDICTDIKKSLGFVSKVQTCESLADALYSTVWTLGCRPYMNSQRAACLCEEEDRDEL
ncbi:group XIIB secretory phospholipase A2-like protein [Thalassophryne amazonica]|uniref:group XIIB secretory phospholipase A2-like protein n=1 Tax=Thalassophryne amazonica TaxID=390379 RepID=UPI001470948C|nr:group XIIB secretory phospholipase A2-like protein [Thalassophryne amazonica]